MKVGFVLQIFKLKGKSHRERELYKLIRNVFRISPSNFSLYTQALCHKSAAKNIHRDPNLSNERLEFLGDAVIDTAIADLLYRRFPEAGEGEMTKMKSRIVSRENLNAVAVKIDLHELIETDQQATSSRESIAGNAFEAVIGALYLDKGYEKSRKATIRFLEEHADLQTSVKKERDFKSRLYEEAHKKDIDVLFKTKEVQAEKGRHKFQSDVFLNGKQGGNGLGSSKKKAEQRASEQALKTISSASN